MGLSSAGLKPAFVDGLASDSFCGPPHDELEKDGLVAFALASPIGCHVPGEATIDHIVLSQVPWARYVRIANVMAVASRIEVEQLPRK